MLSQKEFEEILSDSPLKPLFTEEEFQEAVQEIYNRYKNKIDLHYRFSLEVLNKKINKEVFLCLTK